jgi:O-antigen ligase
MNAFLASIEGASGAGEKVALIALALLAAGAVLVRPTRAPATLKAGLLLGAVVATPLLLAIDVWNSSPLRHLRHHPALAVLAVVAALLVVAALAVLFTRRAWAFPLAVVFTLPLRVPITSGADTANLLVPLYAVVAAGAIAWCVRLRRDAEAGASPDGAASAPARPDGAASAPARPDGAASAPASANGGASPRVLARPPAARLLSPLLSARTLEWLLMASVVLYAVQAVYSDDFSKALQNMAFFYVPFALMLSLLREVRWSRELLVRCVAVSVALAAIFVAIGYVEYASKALLLNASLVDANVYGNYFRVNSVFYDPNIYGRYLALVMLLLATVALWSRGRRQVLISAAALVWLWGGLVTSISQTSMVALLVGLAVLAGWRFGARKAIYAAVALVVVGLVVLLAAPSSLHFGVTGKGGSVNNATSGRANLIRGGVDLFADRPLAGFGSGSFASQYRAHQAASVASSTSASHTIPITVAAEQGAIGLILYVALVLCCFGVLFAWAGRSPPRIAIAACFTALLAHTMAYADFLEDPITWALLGIGMALAGAQALVEATAPAAATAAAAPTAAGAAEHDAGIAARPSRPAATAS